MNERKVSDLYKDKKNEMKNTNKYMKEKVDYIDRRIIHAFLIGIFDLEAITEDEIDRRLEYLPGIYLKFIDILLLMLSNCDHFNKKKVDGITFYRDLWYGYEKNNKHRRVNKASKNQYRLIKDEMRYLMSGYLKNHDTIDMESLKVYMTNVFDFICTQEKIQMNNMGYSNSLFSKIRFKIRKRRYRNIIKSKRKYD